MGKGDLPAEAKKIFKELGKAAQAEWGRICPLLELEAQDYDLLGFYCTERAKYLECQKILDNEGMTFVTEKGYVGQRPEVSIAKGALEAMMRLSGQLGIGLLSKKRLRADKPASKKKGNIEVTDNEPGPSFM